VLLEGFLGPVTLALAGHYYKPFLFAKSLNPNDPPESQNTRYASMEQRVYSYGGRIGSMIGDWGKINISYIQDFSNETGHNFTENRDGKLVPTTGEAEFTTHLFGLYASLVPFKDFGFTLGYSGIVTQYVKEIYALQQMVNTTMPTVFQQGINLNLRYTGFNRLTLRTDHNVSFWADKNFSIFGFPGLKNAGVAPESSLTIGYPMVDHLLIWNGLGVGYQITDKWQIDLYVRNLHRRDMAIDDAKNIEYRFTRNMVHGDLKGTWKADDKLELYVGLVLENTVTVLSEDAHKELAGTRDGFGALANVRETRDTVSLVKIPVGMILKIR
jgi:hypothetical protein